MSHYGERIGKTTVRFERLLPGPIERVWEYLTDSDRRATWLAAGGEPTVARNRHLSLLSRAAAAARVSGNPAMKASSAISCAAPGRAFCSPPTPPIRRRWAGRSGRSPASSSR